MHISGTKTTAKSLDVGSFGSRSALYVLRNTDFCRSSCTRLIGDYVPFIIFVGSLYIVAGGIHLRGSFVGKPWLNTTFLLSGAILANLMGTTGAAMLLIRPLLNANRRRHYQMHTYIFFIFIVANIAGSLTPLGDHPYSWASCAA